MGHYWAFKDQAKETLAAENQPNWVISVDFSKFNLVTGNVQVGDRIIYLKPYKGLPNWGLFQKWPLVFLQSGHFFRSKTTTVFA